MAVEQTCGIAPAVCADHAHLHEILQNLHDSLHANESGRQTIARMIDEFEGLVIEHFRHEEREGFFADIIKTAPRLSERAKALVSQHSEMEAMLYEIRRHLARDAAPDAWRAELNGLFDVFHRTFCAHEAGENRLLQDAYTVDIGAGD